MFNGESKKRPTVSLRGKSKEEDRTEFLRRARAQRQGRARERLHVSSATTIQRIWRGRSCVGKWREREREEWDRKMHDVGRVQAMLAAKGKTFQVPAGVLQTLLSQLVNFHVFPRDTERFRSALGLVLAAAGDTTADPRATGIFAPLISAAVSSTESRDDVMGNKKRPTASDTWRLLVARLGTLCLFYMSQTAGGTVMVGAATDAMEDDEGHDQAGERARVETGSGADTGAVDSAARVFGLLLSPRDWQRRVLEEMQKLEAESLCQDFLTSLAIGRVHVSSPRRKVARGDDSIGAVGRENVEGGKGKGVRLIVRLDRREADGRCTHTPRLFRVLRVLWDAAAGRGETAVVEAKNEASPLRLLCVASLKALGIGITSEARETSPAGGRTALDHPLMSPERKVLLEAFAASILPAPRLLEHPCRALLVDAMFAGEARAWWELVSVAGDAVGEKGACVGETGSARRRDVAWAVANVLKVDTGMVGAGAEQPHALVQALCRLLRKVSLHAVLQGAGRLTAPGGRGAEGAGGMQLDDGPQLEEEDVDEVDIEDIISDAVGHGGTGNLSSATGGGVASGTSDDFAGEGVRLEAIVRFHRRRCAVRIDESPVETLPAVSSRGKRRDLAGPGMERASISASTRAEEVSGELEAMAAAAERLANPAVVGKLFDSILPPVDRLVGSVEEQQQHHEQQFDASKPPSDHHRGDDKYEGRPSDDDGDKCGDDPVLALCILYADMVLDGVHAGPGVAAGAGLGAAAAASGSGSTDKPSSGAGRTTPGKSVLNALAFGRPRAPIAARLWAYLRRRRDLKAYAEGSRTVWSGGGIGGRAGMHSALFLFCSACSHQLLALDDEEFYEKQRPLTLVEVRQLVGFLKKWLCRLYWLDPAIPRLLDDSLPSNPAAAARLCEDRLREALLLLSATRLFNQLYERNTRRSFLEAEQWYWKAISAKELSPPDRGGSRFEFFRRGNLGMVLTNIPQVIPFFQRVSIFRQMIDAERNEHQNTSAFIQSSARIRVSRETLYEDSAEQLTKLGSGLKGRIQVTFLNQHGVEEAGIDGGGVFKEYMDLLTKRAFDPQYALFMATEDQYLFPNPAAPVVAEDYLFHFEFLGRVLGKAVFEDILVEPQFSPVFLNKLLGRHNYIDDLYSLDPELYRNLMQLKAIVQKGGDVEDLSLTFSATTTAFGDAKVWDLIPQGRDVPVTNASVISYIHLMAHFKLNVQTARPCKAFLQGFRDLIPVEWIRLFNPHELQRLIGGEEGRAIDIADLKRNTRYAGGYHNSQPVMQWFWDAIVSFTPEEQGRFLKFVTSCSRPPLLGFERLNPPICVQKVPSGRNGRLPSSSTCMNLLKLPEYEDGQTLRDKLLYAISSNAGFELT